MKRILVPIGCRSDFGLSAPIIKRLKNVPEFEVKTLQLVPCDYSESMALTKQEIAVFKPDLIIIVGDRVEMAGAACAAFLKRVPIAHVYAGVVNDPITTHDDIFRHCITLWSDIQFCEDVLAAEVVWDLKAAAGLGYNAHAVGISHLDDLEVDEGKVPAEPYDLVLYNTPPLSDKRPDHYSIEKMIADKGRLMVQIQGNPDGLLRIIKAANFDYYPNLPRPQFLGLLKNCQRFITNSSAAIYEAPHFLTPEQIIMVGDRNKNRPRGPFKTGASDKIVEILREYLK